MALRCNNCGAPLVVPPEGERAYVVCQYCQTATELPRRRPPREPARRPGNEVVVTSRASSSPLKLFLAIAGLSVFGAVAASAYQAFQANRPLPTALAGASRDTQATRARSLDARGSTAVETAGLRERASGAESARPDATGASRKNPRSAASVKTAPTSAPAPSATASAVPPPKPQNVRAIIGNIQLEHGKYPMSTLKSRMASNSGAARACYEKVLETKPEVEGTLNMRFQISEAGATRGVGVTGSFLPSDLIGCMNRAFLSLKFPPPEDGSVNVRYTVTLSHD